MIFVLKILMETNDFNRIEDQSTFRLKRTEEKEPLQENDNGEKYALLPSKQILTIRRAQVTSSYLEMILYAVKALCNVLYRLSLVCYRK